MDVAERRALAPHEDSRALVLAATLPAQRPTLDPEPWPEPWRPPHLSAGFAVGWVLTVGVLGTITAVWLVGMVFSVVLLVLGQGGMASALAFAGTGVLLGRGWVGMAQTMRGRLRRRDLDDLAALPSVFWTLSPALQRLVRHTRSLQIVVPDPELALGELDREMFEWIAAMAALPPDDQSLLETLGIVPDQLREALVASRQREDRRRSFSQTLVRRPGHRAQAVAVLARVEHELLQPPGDPFRGGRAGRTLSPQADCT